MTIPACSQCGSVGEVGAKCKHPDCQKLGQTHSNSAVKAAYEAGLRAAIARLEARIDIEDVRHIQWSQGADYNSPPHPSGYASKVLHEEAQVLLSSISRKS